MAKALETKSSRARGNEQAQKHPDEFARQSVPTSPHGAVLALQRSAGNHAVNHLLGSGFSALPSPGGAVLQRKCACGANMMGGAECEECSKKKPLGLQTKLKVNEPGDSYEQEADRIAEQVMATPAHHAVSGAPPRIQRFPGQAAGQTDAVPASVNQILASPGTPLEPGLRQDMEQRFGHDFSRVRVHSGPAAEQSARDVNAQAYTMGRHIVFGAGRFAPGAYEGRRLIAHELAHVVQQSGGDGIRAGQSNEKRGLSPISRSPAGDPSVRYVMRRTDPARLPRFRPHVPMVPKVKPAPPAIPCAAPTREICGKKIPGSAFEFSRQTAQAASTTRQQRATRGLATQLRPAPEYTKFTNTAEPEALGDVTAWVDPAVETAGFNSGCTHVTQPMTKSQKAAGCIIIPEADEMKAGEFNLGKATVGGKSREEWKFKALRVALHETAHARFESHPPPGLPAEIHRPATQRNTIVNYELDEMFAQLNDFRFELQFATSLSGPEERTRKVDEFISFHIDNERESFRGMLTQLRCQLPLPEVSAHVTRVFNAATAGWSLMERNLLIALLTHPSRRLCWPGPPPMPEVSRPLPERPRLPPLYQPRRTFIPEIEKSLEELP